MEGMNLYILVPVVLALMGGSCFGGIKIGQNNSKMTLTDFVKQMQDGIKSGEEALKAQKDELASVVAKIQGK